MLATFLEATPATDGRTSTLLVNVAASWLAGALALKLIGHADVRATFVAHGLSGRDLNKPGRPVIAESMGVLAGLVYLVTTFLLIPFLFLSAAGGTAASSLTTDVFSLTQLTTFLSALLSLSCMAFLGFADDVMDLRWRYKLLLPTIASIPLLIVYYVSHGVTHVVVPPPLRDFLGHTVLDLGALYYVYMSMLAVFCTNSINILAGINGVEVGQSIVIAAAMLANDMLFIVPGVGRHILGDTPVTEQARNDHLFSAHLLLPFMAVACALFYHNRYPARVFVGDTFCYFAGMLFAVCGILGHYSKTMLLFFVPQILNFLYSLPQLTRMVPCPRHRMPRFDADTGLLFPSMAQFDPAASLTPMQIIGMQLVHVLAFFRLARIELSSQVEPTQIVESPARKPRQRRKVEQKESKELDTSTEQQIVSVNNLTLLNLLLVVLGPMREDQLCRRVLLIQLLLGTCLPFLIRYGLVRFVFY